MTRTYAILGTGAVGGYHGGLLARNGSEVHFLARADAKHMREHGLRILTGGEEIVLDNAHVYDDARRMPQCDVVIVAVKATSNQDIRPAVARTVKPGGVVLVLQNGLDVERELASSVTSASLAGGVPYVAARRVSPGVIEHLGDGLIELGAWTPDARRQQPGRALEALAADLRRTAVPVNVVDDLGGARWRKLVWGIAFGGLCITLDRDTRGITDDPGAFARARAIMEEIVSCADVCGHPVDAAYVDELVRQTLDLPGFRPSIKRDFDAGAPIELEAIFGNPLRAARHAGHPAPLLESLYAELARLQTKT